MADGSALSAREELDVGLLLEFAPVLLEVVCEDMTGMWISTSCRGLIETVMISCSSESKSCSDSGSAVLVEILRREEGLAGFLSRRVSDPGLETVSDKAEDVSVEVHIATESVIAHCIHWRLRIDARVGRAMSSKKVERNFLKTQRPPQSTFSLAEKKEIQPSESNSEEEKSEGLLLVFATVTPDLDSSWSAPAFGFKISDRANGDLNAPLR